MAAPWRILVALLVFAADIYVGLRWLHRGSGAARTALPFSARRRVESVRPATIAADAAVRKLLIKPDRGAMLGRLLWQHWRQSAWLMLPLAGMWMAFALTIASLFTSESRSPAAGILAGSVIFGAALMGCFVFQPDQQRRQYRFFVEHNIPPRYVWLARQLPWLATLLSTALVIRVVRLGSDGLTHVWQSQASILLAYAVVSYAAGQWTSMLIRSAIIAPVVGVVLSIALCGWVMLMDTMHVNWLWSFAPVPLALLFATWWRAPDWIAENKRWSARGRAAAVVLLPAAALLIAVPIYRVRQIPLVAWGYDVEKILPPITAEARATADLYRRASDLYVQPAKSHDANDSQPPAWANQPFWSRPRRPLTEFEREWLRQNAESLALVMEASRRPTCAFYDPRSATAPAVLRHDSGLVDLVIVSGRKREEEGKLDEALDRYFSALRVDSHLSAFALPYWPGENVQEAAKVFTLVVNWAAEGNQTAGQIDAALDRLRGVDSSMLRLDENLESAYLFARRRVLGDDSAIASGDPAEAQSSESDILWSRLMPWERQRGLRMLKLLNSTAIERLWGMQNSLAKHGGVVEQVVPTYDRSTLSILFQTSYSRGGLSDDPLEEAGWLRTTHPDLAPIGYEGIDAAYALAEFETFRRAAMLRLAIQSYRLKHGALPQSLAELVGPYFHEMPLDPYSGLEFRYFPAGLPPNAVAPVDESGIHPVVQDVPCVWSTGPNLSVELRYPEPDARVPHRPSSAAPVLEYYYETRGPWKYTREYDNVSVWARGFWFPIPERKH
jgi:hypothetical protein